MIGYEWIVEDCYSISVENIYKDRRIFLFSRKLIFKKIYSVFFKRGVIYIFRKFGCSKRAWSKVFEFISDNFNFSLEIMCKRICNDFILRNTFVYNRILYTMKLIWKMHLVVFL